MTVRFVVSFFASALTLSAARAQEIDPMASEKSAPMTKLYVSICTFFFFTCSLTLGSGSIVTKRVLKDHGWTYSQHVFPVSPRNLRAPTNGFPCAFIYLTFTENGFQDHLIASPAYGEGCKFVELLLATAKTYGGHLIAYQTSHLEEIEQQEDGESSVSLTCNSLIDFPLPSGLVVSFRGSNPAFCPSVKLKEN